MKASGEKIETILDSLEGIVRAEAPPFIPGRVLQKIGNRGLRSIWEKGAELISRPSIAFALVFVVLLLNTYFLSLSRVGNNERIPASTAYDYSAADFLNDDGENIWP